MNKEHENQKQKRITSQLKYIAVFGVGYLLGVTAILIDLFLDGVPL